MSGVPVPSSAASDDSPFPFIGAGICKLQITVAVSDMIQAAAALQEVTGIRSLAVSAMRKPLWAQSRQSYPWRVLINDNPVWESNAYNELIITATGVAVGSALIPVSRLLQTLAELKTGITVAEILEIAESDKPHETGKQVVGREYKGWELQVIVDKNWNGVWAEDTPTLEFPIDMGVSDGGH